MSDLQLGKHRTPHIFRLYCVMVIASTRATVEWCGMVCVHGTRSISTTISSIISISLATPLATLATRDQTLDVEADRVVFIKVKLGVEARHLLDSGGVGVGGQLTGTVCVCVCVCVCACVSVCVSVYAGVFAADACRPGLARGR